VLIKIHGEKLFTPGEDADDNDNGENGCRNQVALYINIVK
jgi:hypothetical protein